MCTKYAYNVDFDVEAGIWRAYGYVAVGDYYERVHGTGSCAADAVRDAEAQAYKIAGV